MPQVGDIIEIIDYGRPDDQDLIDWASEQHQDSYKIININTLDQVFYIENCNYAIPFDSIDYKIVS